MMSFTLRCTYCPNPATTKDDVPPKCLFSKPLPSTLITVPSCGPCNNGASKDDEYFMVRLVLNRRLSHPEAAAVRETAIRSLARAEAPGFRADFIGTVADEEVLTPAGLYLGTVATYGAATERLSRVLRRIALGLRYHETGQWWEPDERVHAVVPDAVAPGEVHDKLIHDARELRRFGRPGTTARSVLMYWWAPIARTVGGSAWLLRFYEQLSFMAYISKDQPVQEDRSL